MGISIERFAAHKISYMSKFQNYRQRWPNFTYRHEPVDNAIALISKGQLLSREHAGQLGVIINDIAPIGIIDNRTTAHLYGRMYFRPRTPTQFHIEGIRKLSDFYQGRHAGFLVMLMFDAEQVLTDSETRFSCGNMQSHSSVVRDGDPGFDALDFENIYHDSPGPTSEILRNRHAEVLVHSPFQIQSSLVNIAVRTDADAQCVKYLLSEAGCSNYSAKVRKSSSGGIFFNRFTAVDFIDCSPNRINFQLKYTSSTGDVVTSMRLVDSNGIRTDVLRDVPLATSKRYYAEHRLAKGAYVIEIDLEGCFAHRSLIDLV